MALSNSSFSAPPSELKSDSGSRSHPAPPSTFSQIEHLKSRINQFEKELFTLSERFEQHINVLKSNDEISPHSTQDAKEEGFTPIDLAVPKTALESIIKNYQTAINTMVDQMISLSPRLSDFPNNDTCIDACNTALHTINLLIAMLNKAFIVLSCKPIGQPTLQTMTQSWIQSINLSEQPLPLDRLLFENIQAATVSLFDIVNHALRNTKKIHEKIKDHLTQSHSNASSLSNSQQLSASLSTLTLGEQTRQVSPILRHRVLSPLNTSHLTQRRITPPNTPIPINGYDPSFFPTPRSRVVDSRSQNSLSSTESNSHITGNDSDRSTNTL